MERHRFTIGGTMWINLANTIMMRDKQKTDMLEELDYIKQWLSENDLALEGSLSPSDLRLLQLELFSLRAFCIDALADLLQEGQLSVQTYTLIAKKTADITVDVRMEQQEGRPVMIYDGHGPLDRIRYAVLSSLADTLGKHSPERIRKCEHDACILHFLDTSKSGKRRWCSMDQCGNRQKAAEFYAKKKKKTGEDPDAED